MLKRMVNKTFWPAVNIYCQCVRVRARARERPSNCSLFNIQVRVCVWHELFKENIENNKTKYSSQNPETNIYMNDQGKRRKKTKLKQENVQGTLTLG